MIFRVYKDGVEGSTTWSVDQGTKATAQSFEIVLLRGASGNTKVNLSSEVSNDPQAWIEVEGDLIVTGSIAVVGEKARSFVTEANELWRIKSKDL